MTDLGYPDITPHVRYRLVKMYNGEKHDDRNIINDTFVCEKVNLVENYRCSELRIRPLNLRVFGSFDNIDNGGKNLVDIVLSNKIRRMRFPI